MRKPLISAMQVLVVCMSLTYGESHSQETAHEKPAKVVQVRGRDSIVEELNIGPDATAFWRKLQQLFRRPEMVLDVPELQKHFGWVGAATPVLAGPPQARRRFDLRDPHAWVNSIVVGQTYDDRTGDRSDFVAFSVNLKMICVSEGEAERALGKGRLSHQADGPVDLIPGAYDDPYGLFRSVTYRTPNSPQDSVVLGYAASGCVESVSVGRPLEADHSTHD